MDTNPYISFDPSPMLCIVMFGFVSLLLTGLVWLFVGKRRTPLKVGLVLAGDLVLTVLLVLCLAYPGAQQSDVAAAEATKKQQLLDYAAALERNARSSIQSAEAVEKDPSRTIKQYAGRPEEYIQDLRDQAASYQADAEAAVAEAWAAAGQLAEDAQPSPLVIERDIALTKIGLIVLTFGLAAVMMFFALRRDPGAGPLMRVAAPVGVMAVAAGLVWMQIQKEQRFAADRQVARAQAQAEQRAADAALEQLTKPRIELDATDDREQPEQQGTSAGDEADIPAWVTNPPSDIGETCRLVLFAEGNTPRVCRLNAEHKLQAVAELYARGDHAALKRAGGPRGYVEPDLGSAFVVPALRQRLVKGEHLDRGMLSSGVLGQTRAMLVAISPEDGDWLQAMSEQINQQRATSTAAWVSAGVLGALAVAYAALKRLPSSAEPLREEVA